MHGVVVDKVRPVCCPESPVSLEGSPFFYESWKRGKPGVCCLLCPSPLGLAVGCHRYGTYRVPRVFFFFLPGMRGERIYDSDSCPCYLFGMCETRET